MKTKATNKILAGFAALALIAMTAGFAVNINGAIVNALTGFQFNGAAPNGHVLCGNGSLYVDAASCGAAANYQTMQSNSTPLTQRGILNFDTNFALADTSPSTTVHLASSIGVNAATATALAATPAQCTGGSFATGIAANGAANCTVIPGANGSLTDVTGSRSFVTVFTNSNTAAMYVSGFGVTTSGGDTSQIDCVVNGIRVWSSQANATVAGGHTGFSCMVPAGGAYSVSASGTTAVTLGGWAEFVY